MAQQQPQQPRRREEEARGRAAKALLAAAGSSKEGAFGARLLVVVATAAMLVAFVLFQRAPANGRWDGVSKLVRVGGPDEGGAPAAPAADQQEGKKKRKKKGKGSRPAPIEHISAADIQSAGIVRFSDGEDPLRKGKPRRAHPVFLHIAKTGGTAVENIARAEYGIAVGRWAFESQRRSMEASFGPLPEGVPREGRPDWKRVGPCSGWHQAPTSFVPESFTVVRNPYVRFLSEFCHSMRSLQNKRKTQRRVAELLKHFEGTFGNGTSFAEAFSQADDADAGRKTCEMFSKSAVPRLRAAVEAARRGKLFFTYDCHMMKQVRGARAKYASARRRARARPRGPAPDDVGPRSAHVRDQSAYYRNAEWIIEQRALESGLHRLLALYGLRPVGEEAEGTDAGEDPAGAGLPPEEDDEDDEAAAAADPTRVCEAYAFDCMTDEVAMLIVESDGDAFADFGYSRDWRRLRRALPDHNYEHAVDPAEFNKRARARMQAGEGRL